MRHLLRTQRATDSLASSTCAKGWSATCLPAVATTGRLVARRAARPLLLNRAHRVGRANRPGSWALGACRTTGKARLHVARGCPVFAVVDEEPVLVELRDVVHEFVGARARVGVRVARERELVSHLFAAVARRAGTKATAGSMEPFSNVAEGGARQTEPIV